MLLKSFGLLGAASVFAWTFCAKVEEPSMATRLSVVEGEPEAIYKQYCSGCHGEKVEMFVDRKWKYGNEKQQLIQSITNGSLDYGMPAWKEVISAEEIDALAGLIVEKLATVNQYQFSSKPTSNVYEAASGSVRLDTVLTGLSSPWGIAQLPNGDLLVTDRAGTLHWVNRAGEKKIVSGTPQVVAEGQGGLLDVAIDPAFAKNGFIYLSYSKGKKEGNQTVATTAIFKAKLENGALINGKDIFVAEPWSRARHHYGSRIVFDKAGFLYFSVGDRGNQAENPQSLASDAGKIHRIKSDGTIPADNPFVKTAGARPSIYSYGHRNPQGVYYHAGRNEIWAHEHGPRGGDEVNVVEKGKNYGWPVISYGINYDGKAFTNLTEKEGMEQPEIYWIPSIAPSGMTFVTSDKYPNWKGDLVAGSLRFKYLNRCIVKDGKIVGEEKLLPNSGRMRSVVMGQDGFMYIGVEDPGMVVRVVPL